MFCNYYFNIVYNILIPYINLSYLIILIDNCSRMINILILWLIFIVFKSQVIYKCRSNGSQKNQHHISHSSSRWDMSFYIYTVSCIIWTFIWNDCLLLFQLLSIIKISTATNPTIQPIPLIVVLLPILSYFHLHKFPYTLY